jgi:small subunit ribosomal protein S20
MAKEKEDKKKVKRPTAQKRDMQHEKRRVQNKSFRARVLTAMRSLETSIAQKESGAALGDKLSAVYSLMDKGVKTGVYTVNKASRVKARLTQRAKA